MLKTPQTQNRAAERAASAGVRRPSLTQSIIFFAKLAEIIPWPHIVESSNTGRSGRRSICPRKPSEYSTLCRVIPASWQQRFASSIRPEMLMESPRSASFNSSRKATRFCLLSDGPDHGREEVLLGHPPEAVVTLNARILVDDRPSDPRVNVDRSHRTDRYTVTAGHAPPLIDPHRPTTYHGKGATVNAREDPRSASPWSSLACYAPGGISLGAPILCPPLMREENNPTRLTPTHTRYVAFMADTKARGFSGVGAAPGIPE